MRSFLIAVSRNPLSMLGAAIATACALVMLSLLALELVGLHVTPYVGILIFLILPAILLAALLLIPLGLRRERRRQAGAEGEEAGKELFPVIDFNRESVRRAAFVIFVLSVVNLVLFAAATYKGVEVMESDAFCGETCHSVMEPEYRAYQASVHADVGCVQCHIGPGAESFLKAKLNGAWQVASVNFDLYERPIPAPVHDLRPAGETCGACHRAGAWTGDKLKVIPIYGDDEANTRTSTVLAMHVGGRRGGVKDGASEGIHWHADPKVEVRYRSDPKRERIGTIEVRYADGSVKTFLPPEGFEEEAGEGDGATAIWRTMDCTDCHNRVGHPFLSPERAVDEALDAGLLDASLPFLRREAVAALTAGDAGGEGEGTEKAAALDAVAAHIVGFYSDEHPDVLAGDREAVEGAARVVADLYDRNVYPRMRLGWGSYPSHLGHELFPGCFRCHDDEHATEEGETLAQDCFACHSMIAVEEEEPEILALMEE